MNNSGMVDYSHNRVSGVVGCGDFIFRNDGLQDDFGNPDRCQSFKIRKFVIVGCNMTTDHLLIEASGFQPKTLMIHILVAEQFKAENFSAEL